MFFSPISFGFEEYCEVDFEIQKPNTPTSEERLVYYYLVIELALNIGKSSII